MSHTRYDFLVSEVHALEALFEEMPANRIFSKIGFQTKLDQAKNELVVLGKQAEPLKAKLTFRGRPVWGSRGIAASFAAQATTSFTDAVAAVAAGFNQSLRYMGPIPNRDENQLFITGTAIGSFGFEFELPAQQPESSDLFPESKASANRTEQALETIQALMQATAVGSDDDVAEIIQSMHKRAVSNVAAFLDSLAQHDATCGLAFKNIFFKFDDVAQLQASALRLKENNIHETQETFTGEFQGVLPASRTFEFKTNPENIILKGKVDFAIQDADILNRDWMHKPAKVQFSVKQVGQGRPRYALIDTTHIMQTSP